MFLSHWFEFSGIDQVMAPIDDNSPPVANDANNNDGNDGGDHGDGGSIIPDFWELVAPRSQPTSARDSTSTAAKKKKSSQQQQQQVGSPSAMVSPVGKLVECRHCHQMTPVDGPTTTTTMIANNNNRNEMFQQLHRDPTTPCATHPKTPYNTPAATNTTDTANHTHNHTDNGNANDDNDSMFHTAQIQNEQTHLHSQVLAAAQATALASSAPSFQWKNSHTLFESCAAPTKPPKKGSLALTLDANSGMTKNVKKIHKILTQKPGMVGSRSANMSGTLNLPDGFTVLHAACHVGNVDVVEYLLANHVNVVNEEANNDGSNNGRAEDDGRGRGTTADRPMLDLNEVNTQGRTALHIAAEQGHVEVIRLLRKYYIKLEESEKKLLEEEDGHDGSDEENEKDGGAKEDGKKEVEQGLREEMAKLSTSESTHGNAAASTATPRTTKSPKRGSNLSKPFGRSPKKSPKRMRTPKTPMSKSPKPPSSTHRRSPMRSPIRSPTFAGASAPIDLSGRTPLGYAATSPVPRAKKNRAELEALLYEPGDRSIVGCGGCATKTPPKSRCGPARGGFVSPGAQGVGVGGVGVGRTPGSGRKVVAFNGEEGTNSYLSPTPHKHRGRFATPGSVASSKFATPFSSPPTIQEEGQDGGGEKEAQEQTTGSERGNAMQLQWGASEMNGWRIDMEDKILVQYELYGEGEKVPPRPSSLDVDSTADTSTAIISTMGLFGVFDGHGDGGFASDFVASNLWGKLQSQPDWALAYHSCNSSYKHLPLALTRACYELDDDLRKDVTKPRDGGTTAVMALVSDGYLFVANVGDSRCILVKKKIRNGTKDAANSKQCWQPSQLEVIPMSEDHKPDLPEERARIESSGLSVQTDRVPPDENDEHGEFTTVHRVKKSAKEMLGVSRAFGDYDYKSNGELSASRQAVVCTPDIVVRERVDCEDMYLVLACDGIWDVMSNDDVGEFVARRVAEEMGWVDGGNEEDVGAKSDQNQVKASNDADMSNNTVQGEVLAQVGDDLLTACLNKGSRDNMSVLIVALPASGLLSTPSSSSFTGVSTTTTDATAVPIAEGGTAVRALAYE